jgi:hypothetical protein
MVWQGVVQSLAPLVGGSVYLWWHHRRQPAVEGETNWLSPIGSNGVRLAVLVAMLMWVVPAGALLAVPLALGISLLSPAARAEWTDHRRVRIAAVSVAVLFLGVTGFLPVEEPVAPEAWGQPLFTENPHAPLYPTSQQYTWLTSDVVVLQSVSVRLPHQPGVVGAEWTAMGLASLLNMETSRMHQAIQLIDDELPFQLDPEEVFLSPIPSPNNLDIRLSSEVTETVEFRRYDIKTTAIGMDPSGTKVGEVVTAGQASWGGQLNMLIVVRPIAHPTLATDSNGETYMMAWLNAA